ncbi:MAG: thermonuclease family protein [Magnetococcales bacterium]|nr:thermonuclease family protein [Magnetococcales bacterium]
MKSLSTEACVALAQKIGSPVRVASLFLLVLACPELGMSQSGVPSSITGTAKVADGDTLTVNGRKIRLHGVDAWELRQSCPDGSGKPFPCGKLATAFLKDKIKNKQIECKPQVRDRYERLVGRCSLDGQDLGAMLVEHGWAVAYVHYSTSYLPLEQQAKNQRLGGWRGLPLHEPTPPKTWRMTNKHTYRPRSDHQR